MNRKPLNFPRGAPLVMVVALKVLDIVVMPLVLTLALFGWHRWRLRRRQAADQR